MKIIVSRKAGEILRDRGYRCLDSMSDAIDRVWRGDESLTVLRSGGSTVVITVQEADWAVYQFGETIAGEAADDLSSRVLAARWAALAAEQGRLEDLEERLTEARSRQLERAARAETRALNADPSGEAQS